MIETKKKTLKKQKKLYIQTDRRLFVYRRRPHKFKTSNFLSKSKKNMLERGGKNVCSSRWEELKLLEQFMRSVSFGMYLVKTTCCDLN